MELYHDNKPSVDEMVEEMLRDHEAPSTNDMPRVPSVEFHQMCRNLRRLDKEERRNRLWKKPRPKYRPPKNRQKWEACQHPKTRVEQQWRYGQVRLNDDYVAPDMWLGGGGGGRSVRLCKRLVCLDCGRKGAFVTEDFKELWPIERGSWIPLPILRANRRAFMEAAESINQQVKQAEGLAQRQARREEFFASHTRIRRYRPHRPQI